jgi:DNA-binding transcriptional MocR family regulator
MKTAAPDFRLMWDDAYRFHHLGERKLAVANILAACAKAGNPDRAIVFASSSKVSWAGSGVAALAASPANIAWWTRHAGLRSIGPDKINQLRHVRFLKDLPTVEALMEQHRQLLKPKFDAVLAQFQKHLGEVPGVSWTRPEGGYFIDLITPDGAAKRTVALAKEAGITLTPAGAGFPYGVDPRDRHIRIAPSFPSLEEINQAAQGIACRCGWRWQLTGDSRTKKSAERRFAFGWRFYWRAMPGCGSSTDRWRRGFRGRWPGFASAGRSCAGAGRRPGLARRC